MTEESQLVSLALGFALANRIDIFAAAGNTAGNKVLYPSSFEKVPDDLFPLPSDMPRRVISVTSTDGQKKLSPFAGYGLEVDLACIGYRVCSLVPGGQTSSWSGTSMATAVACGAALLVRSKLPAAYDGPLGELLCDTADSIDGLNPGFALKLGDGLFDTQAALQKARQDLQSP
jgi:subtilisin family serine protease